jgi:hypothetical protein
LNFLGRVVETQKELFRSLGDDRTLAQKSGGVKSKVGGVNQWENRMNRENRMSRIGRIFRFNRFIRKA